MAAKAALTANVEDIGLLLVHGIGEQKRLEHLRCTAADIASYVEETPNLHRLSVTDRSAEDGLIVIDAAFADGGREKQVRLNCREVWWADLGASGGLGAQIAFWFWGLGEWAAEIHFKGKKLSNTSELMANPHFAGDKTGQPPGHRHRLITRVDLLFAGVLALLTLVTWWLAKHILAVLTRRAPDPSLIFLFLGDVKAYQQPGGPGRGTQEDPNMPRRATIRRRMVSATTEMASQGYDRWYVLAHSLGSVLAFNALQETEIALPNYLEEAEWASLPAGMKTKTPYAPAGVHPSTKEMMPRRPTWLDDHDGISREALFERFAGLITYGSPLDKFAALWPRIVCLNKQRAVFRRGCEWLNLYDPTDPVGASLGAFGSKQEKNGLKVSLVPRNVGCRASKVFLLSHIRYLNPRKRREHPMATALINALLRGEELVPAARKAANSKLRNAHRLILAVLQVIGLFALLTAATAGLIVFGKLTIFGKAVFLGSFSACSPHLWAAACGLAYARTAVAVFGAAVGIVLIVGALRVFVYDRRFSGK